jgi:hypothetical protein
MLRRREKTLKFLAEVDARIARALADDDEDE